VFGMPKEAITCGAVDTVLPLSKIPEKILQSESHKRHFTSSR